MTALAERRVLRLPSELTRAEIIEDLEFMARTGVGFIEAAHRVGKTADACQRFLERHGRTDLYAALRSHDPDAEPIRTPERKSPAWASGHAAFLADCETARLDALAVWPDDDLMRERRQRCLGGAA